MSDIGIAPVARAEAAPAQPASATSAVAFDLSAQQAIPHSEVKLSGLRKTIARRLTESKQQIPHIYLTVDVRLDALLVLSSELNASLGARDIKLSVNDMLIKALALALIEVPQCNVSFAGDTRFQSHRADISVAVSIANDLITPIITGAEAKSLSSIAMDMKALATRAREGKLQRVDGRFPSSSQQNDLRGCCWAVSRPSAFRWRAR